MKILAVETATSWQSVAVMNDQMVVSLVTRDAGGSHAKHLIPSIDEALRTAGLSLPELDGLAVSIGPGSFTGLRVGLATVLGFRSVFNKPLVAVPTLEAMAWNVRPHQGLVCPILKSRKNELYWARYAWTPDGLRSIGTEQVGSPELLAASIQEPVMLFGEGWESCKDEICKNPALRRSFVMDAPLEAMRPSAVSVALAARDRFTRGECAAPGIGPRYVQRAEADIRFEADGGFSPLERRKERIARKTQGRRRPPGVERRGSRSRLA